MKQRKWRLLLTLVMAITIMCSGISIPAGAATNNLSEVSVNKKVTVYVGIKKKLKVKGTDSKTKIQWKSANKKVVKVSKNGVAKGIKPGKTTIKMTATIGKKSVKKSIKVTVKKPVRIKKIVLSASSVQIVPGQQLTVNSKITPAKASVKDLEWSSSNSSVVTVSNKGIVTAKGNGTAKITAKAKDGSKKKASITITVTSVKMADSIIVSTKKTELVAGEKTKLEMTPQPAGAVLPTLSYESSDPYAATVSADGTITALAQGTTVITAKSQDGRVSGSVEITVDYDRTKVNKPRVCITNDGEIDDKNSYVHLLYYANEIDLVGLVQTSSFAHWAGTDNPDVTDNYKVPYAWPGTEWQDEFIDAYAEIYPNLRVHDNNYPTPNYLHSLVKIGNIGYTGDMDNATEGSEHIKNLILDNVPGPLYITAWGGMNTVGRALRDIYEQYGNTDEWESVRQKIYDKVRIYMWYGQDKPMGSDAPDPVFDGVCAQYYPDMVYVDVHSCNALGWGWENASTNNGTIANKNHPIPEVYTGEWMLKNLENSQGGTSKYGPLMDWYVTYGDGTHVNGETSLFQMGENDACMIPFSNGGKGIFAGTGRNRYDFCGEGDTPTYLPFFDMGLDSLENYGYGNLAGRFVKDELKEEQGITNYYVPQNDEVQMSDWANVGKTTELASYDSGARWVTDIFNAFAARAEWGISSDYEDANHRPEVMVKEGNKIEAASGERVTLNAVAKDPDGDSVSLKWFNYKEAGTYGADITISGGGKGPRTSFVVPDNAKSGDTIHMLVKATDNGKHNLSYYQRVVITVK